MRMYGIIACKDCGRKRIIDLCDDITACPYCGERTVTKNAAVLFQADDQSAVRSALGSGCPIEKKKVDENIDPMSTLTYKVEHTSDLQTKLQLIAEGLTRMNGSFTVEDVEGFVGPKAEQYIKAMLDSCMIYEKGYGRYSV